MQFSSILFFSRKAFLRHLQHNTQRKETNQTNQTQPSFSSKKNMLRRKKVFNLFRKARFKFTPEARKPHTRTRNTDNKNVFRSFLLCWHQSRRQDERPRLCFLEKSVGASLRRKKTLVRVLVLNFFFCKSALFERARG